MATISNFYIEQGATFSSIISLENTTPGLFQLDPWTARGKIRKSHGSQSYTSFRCTINENSPVQDTLTIELTPAQTKAMKSGRYVYDVEIYNSTTGEVIRLLEGQAEVLAAVTQANPLAEGIEFKYTAENFKPHYMYNPNNGEAVYVQSIEDHDRFHMLNYVHVRPVGGQPSITVSETVYTGDTTSNSPGDSGGEGEDSGYSY